MDNALLTTRPPALPSMRNCFSRSWFFKEIIKPVKDKFDRNKARISLFFL